uniref:Uncharacterized protein n=1 Tax=viral metagenome TaxID=1070528 RepID=A0A6C0EX27_9ZZZZ
MNYSVAKSQIIVKYKSQLPEKLQKIYEEITNERTTIYYQGYALGFILSLFIIIANVYSGHKMLSTMSMVCLVLATSFITNYFYYILSPKKNWMLNYIETPDQTKLWLQMYRGMQVYYHTGLVLGIIAVSIFAHAFRARK